MATTTRRRSVLRILGDWLLTIALAAISTLFVVYGTIGHPFALGSRRGQDARAERFWAALERGDRVWFADHLVWFPAAALFIVFTIGMIQIFILPRSELARRLLLASFAVTALVSIAALAALLVLWLTGTPASSMAEFSTGVPYLVPILVTAGVALFTGGTALIARRLGLFRRRR